MWYQATASALHIFRSCQFASWVRDNSDCLAQFAKLIGFHPPRIAPQFLLALGYYVINLSIDVSASCCSSQSVVFSLFPKDTNIQTNKVESIISNQLIYKIAVV